MSIALWWELTVITQLSRYCAFHNSKEGTCLALFLHHLWSLNYLQKAMCKSPFKPNHTHSQHRLRCMTGSCNGQQSCQVGKWERRGRELPEQQGALTSLCQRGPGAAAREACREGIAVPPRELLLSPAPVRWLVLKVVKSWCSEFPKPGFSSMWTVNFLMFKLVLEKAEEPEIKLPTSAGS